MKSNLLRLAGLVAALALAVTTAVAASSPAKSELQALVAKVRQRIAAGHNTAAALAPELAQFDALLARHAGEKTDDVAQILVMKAGLYAQVFKDSEKAIAFYEQLKVDFAGTDAAGKADAMIASVRRRQEASRIQNSLAIGTPFPEFAAQDRTGQERRLADYRGKVVLVDFWAMWCQPCQKEIPNVVKAYQKHHAAGLEIIGVSLDRKNDGPKLDAFTKARHMPWPQIFDGGYWQSELAVKYGVNSIPATFLIDREGNIAAKNLRGNALEREIARLLAKS